MAATSVIEEAAIETGTATVIASASASGVDPAKAAAMNLATCVATGREARIVVEHRGTVPPAVPVRIPIALTSRRAASKRRGPSRRAASLADRSRGRATAAVSARPHPAGTAPIAANEVSASAAAEAGVAAVEAGATAQKRAATPGRMPAPIRNRAPAPERNRARARWPSREARPRTATARPR